MMEARNTGRLLCVAAALVMMWVGLCYRLVWLHCCVSGDVRARIERHRNYLKEIRAGRGRIFDRGGKDNILALDLLLKDVVADPARIAEDACLDRAVDRLAPVLGIPCDELRERLDRPERRFERLRRGIADSEAERISALQLPGVGFRETIVRRYPQKAMLCHVLGFVNHEGVGSCGVEQTMNGLLRSRAGLIEGKLDGHRHELYERRVQDLPAVEGADVILTIDENIQYFVERALDAVVEKYNPRSACAIVERVATGEILAMAARPAYDLNEFNLSAEDERLNRAIGMVYEPGSTMKALTMSAVLNEGLVEPSRSVFCENGAWMHRGRPLRDFHPYGELTVADVLKKSSNIGVAKLALMLGETRLAAYLKAFGLGSRTGIDLPGEEEGILHPVERWSGLSCSRIAIGQGVAVTALQMVNAYCAIANNGVLMRPYVVRRVTAKSGETLFERAPGEAGRPLKPQTAATMRSLLARVTEAGGTGTRARVAGLTVAGKTGSAQKPEGGGYSTTAYFASFVGFIPAENPQLGIIVMVDEPQPAHTGGVVAAPVFGEIARRAVGYLGLLPEPEGEMRNALAIRE